MKKSKIFKRKVILNTFTSVMALSLTLGASLSFIDYHKTNTDLNTTKTNLAKNNNSQTNLALQESQNQSQTSTSSLLGNKYLLNDDTLNAWNNVTNADLSLTTYKNYFTNNNLASNGQSNVQSYASWLYQYIQENNSSNNLGQTTDLSNNFSALSALLNDHFLVTNASINATAGNSTSNSASMTFSTNKASNTPGFNLQVNPFFVNGLYNISQIFNTFAVLAGLIVQPANYTPSTSPGVTPISLGSYGYPQFGSYYSLYSAQDGTSSVSVAENSSIIPLETIKANWNYLFCLVASGCFENSSAISLSSQLQNIITATNNYTPADGPILQQIRSASSGNNANINGQYFCPEDKISNFANLDILIPVSQLTSTLQKNIIDNSNNLIKTTSYINLWQLLYYGYNWLNCNVTISPSGTQTTETVFKIFFNSNLLTSAPTNTATDFNTSWNDTLNNFLSNADASNVTSSAQNTSVPTYNYYFTNYIDSFVQNTSYYTASIGTGSPITLHTPYWFNNVLNYGLNPLTITLFDTMDVNALTCFFNFSYITQSTSILDYKVMQTNDPSSTYTLGVNLGALISNPNNSLNQFATCFSQNTLTFNNINGYDYMESLSLNYFYWTYNFNLGYDNSGSGQTLNGISWWNYETGNWTQTSSASMPTASASLGGNGWLLGSQAQGSNYYTISQTDFTQYFTNEMSTSSLSGNLDSQASGLLTNLQISNLNNYETFYEHNTNVTPNITLNLYIYNTNNKDYLNNANGSPSNPLSVALVSDWWGFDRDLTSYSGINTNNNNTNSTTIWSNVNANLNNTDTLQVQYTNASNISDNLDPSNLLYFYDNYDLDYLQAPTNLLQYINLNDLTTFKTSILNYTYSSYNDKTYGNSSIDNTVTIAPSSTTAPFNNTNYFNKNYFNTSTNNWALNLPTSSQLTSSSTLSLDASSMYSTSEIDGHASTITYKWQVNGLTDFSGVTSLQTLTLNYNDLKALIATGSSSSIVLTLTYKSWDTTIQNYNTTTQTATITLYQNANPYKQPQASTINNTYNTFLISGLTVPLNTFANSIFTQKSNNVTTLNSLSDNSTFLNNSNLQSQVLYNSVNGTSSNASYYYTINSIFSNRYNVNSDGGYTISPQTYGNNLINYNLSTLMGNSISIQTIDSYKDLTSYETQTLINYFTATNYVSTSAYDFPITNANNGVYVALVNFNSFDNIENGNVINVSSVFYLYNMTYNATASIGTSQNTQNLTVDPSTNTITINLQAIPSLANYTYSNPSAILSTSINNNTLTNSNTISKTVLYSILTSLISSNALKQNYNYANLRDLIANDYITTSNVQLATNSLTCSLVLPSISYPSVTNTQNNNDVTLTITGFAQNNATSSANYTGDSSNISKHNQQVNTANTLSHNSLIIGLGVGVPVAVIVLVFIIALIWLAAKGKIRNWKYVRNKRFK